MRTLLISLAVLAVAAPVQAQFRPEQLTPLGQKIETALKSDVRPAEDKVRDEERRPRQTLEFFGLRDDMRVVELIPGGGWYTRILAEVLAEKGELYVSFGTRQIEPMVTQVPAMAKVKIARSEGKLTPAAGPMGLFELGEASLGVSDADLVLTFRNLHNLTAPSRANLHKAVLNSLKSGGLYGVVDHTRRHNEPDNSENWRRMDPVLAIKEIQAAGFVLVDFSNVHFRPDDELRYEVGRKTVTGNTDRFTLLFRKP
jgi:predicted methyltransferase